MKKIYFENIGAIGNLMLEKTLISFESSPLIFTCIDGNGQRYICFCADFGRIGKWIVAPISPKRINDLLRDNIDIRSAFTAEPEVYYITYENTKDHAERVKTEAVMHYLPDNGEFLEYEEFGSGEDVSDLLLTDLTSGSFEVGVDGYVSISSFISVSCSISSDSVISEYAYTKQQELADVMDIGNPLVNAA